MANHIELNKTNQVVRAASQIASREVRVPKVVRTGAVQKMAVSNPQKG